MNTTCNITLTCGCRTDGAAAAQCEVAYKLERAAILYLENYRRTDNETDWQNYCDCLDELERHYREEGER